MNIQNLRADTPACQNLIHLNNAGAALPPHSVVEKMKQVLDLEAQIGGYEAMDFLQNEVLDFYPTVARLLGCQPRNVAFAYSATDAYNKALSAIPFEAGDTILTTVNDYASNQIAFLSLQKRLKINVLRAEDLPTGGVDVADFEKKLLENRPRLAAVTHVPTNSGLIQNVEAIGKICRREGVWYLVDACQSAGQMPLDVEKIGCDFLSSTGRKYLRGPRTSGFLFVSDRALAAGLEPLFIDMFGSTWLGETYEPRLDARRFEQYENAPALVLGLKTAIEYALNLGIENIQKRVFELADFTRKELEKLSKCRVLDLGIERCGIVTAYFEGENPTDLMAFLSSKNVNVRVGPKHAATLDFQQKGVNWALRITPHYYNTIEEIEFLIEKLKERG